MTDLNRRRGDTYADQFEVTSETTGSAIDITGYTFTMTIASKLNPADDTFKLFEVAGTITSAGEGLVEFGPSSAQTDRVGVFYFDISMVDGSGGIRTIDKGKYEITQDITK